MKYLLIGIALFIAAAFIWFLIVEFKWVFITLGVLAVIAMILKFVMKRKKTVVASEIVQAGNSELPETVHNSKESKLPKTKITAYPVKGVFAHEDEIFHNLMGYNAEYDYSKEDMIEFCVPDTPVYKWVPKGIPASLVPEPDNKYDPNAVRVVVGEFTIGYIPRESCLEVLDAINGGRIENIAYEINGGAFKLLEEDYDPLKDKSKYTLKTGKGELYAWVYVKTRIKE